MSKIIVDGCVIVLANTDARYDIAKDLLYKSDPGQTLVAVSRDSDMLIRWIDSTTAAEIANHVTSTFVKKKKPTKEVCPWLFEVVENQFEQVARDNESKIRDMYESSSEKLIARGKPTESFRRWFAKIKKRWVKNTISSGCTPELIEDAVH